MLNSSAIESASTQVFLQSAPQAIFLQVMRSLWGTYLAIIKRFFSLLRGGMRMQLHKKLLVLHSMKNSGMMHKLHMDWMTERPNIQAVTSSRSIVTNSLRTGLIQAPRNITGKRIANSNNVQVCLLHETRFYIN